MRILMLSPYVPWPLNGGPPIRIYYVLRELVRLGHEVTFLVGYNGPALEATHPLQPLCREILTYQPPSSARRVPPVISALRSLASPLPYVAAKFGSPRIDAAIRLIASQQHFDLIWANFAFMACAVPPELAQGTPVVLDEHESEGLLWRQYWRLGSLPKKMFALINLAKLPRFQKRLMSRVAVVLSNSEREAEFTRRHADRPVWAVPNGVDTEKFAPAPDHPKQNVILICGGLAVYRNREAAIWFARRVFPQVCREVPDAEFWIVGSNANREIFELAELPGVHVTGTVEDVRPYYAMAKVALAPYRYGEGTKLKVVEAMACGVPIVSTAIGCQGLDVVHDRHLLIAECESDFGAAVIRLLRDPELAARLGAEARRLAVKRYSWERLFDELEPKLENLTGLSSEKTVAQAAVLNG